MNIYLTDEEVLVIKKSLHRYTKDAIRQSNRSRTSYLEEINRRQLAILASIERKLNETKI